MKQFNNIEQLNLLLVLSLVAWPGLSLLAISLVGRPHPALPIVSALILAVAAKPYFHFTNIRFSQKSITSSPLLWAALIQLSIILITTNAFLALPDVDAFHWIKVFNQDFNTSHIAALPQRPLFHSLVYILTSTFQLPTISIFKYAIPLLTLTALIPAWLVARRLTNKSSQLLLLLTPTLSPSLILSQYMGTPQAILLTLSIFFIYFLIYSYLTGHRFWHYLAGAIIAVAAIYHGLALLILAGWLAATIIHSKRRMFGIALALLIFVISIPYLTPRLPQITSDIRFNLAFPSSYTTIDGVANGWPGLSGFIQYYGFYVGPAAALILLATIYRLVTNRQFRRQFTAFIASGPAPTALLIIFLIFFLIAEVAPRFLNVAILPERAWLFSTLASLVFLYPILITKFAGRQQFTLILLGTIGLSLAGAVYVNNLKAHLLPDYAVKSAQWIDQNLPSADILTTHGPDYLDLYISQPITALPTDFFCEHSESTGSELSQAIMDLRPASAINPTYVYYFADDPLHPYQDRPWWRGSDSNCNRPLLKQFPDQFSAIYNDQDQAIIWQVL